MRRFAVFILALCLLSVPCYAAESLKDEEIKLSSPSAVLMETKTGTVIYEKDAHTRRSPASVTKIMTMLLVMEAIDAGTLRYDSVVCASAHASGMGGSQIWLEEGESMTVDEMLKCVAVVSANDCAVALAEHLAGSEDAFVKRMNDRAKELHMEDTHFTNCTGLTESSEHYTSACDIAIMSCELLRHEDIKRYTTVWTDEIRNGEFGLSNTNKMVRFYEGTTGLKTGFTSEAMYCLAASAERDGVEYVAVVLHGPTSQDRFEDAKTLLNYGFANYSLLRLRPDEALAPVPVKLGKADAVVLEYQGAEYLLIDRSSSVDPEFRLEILDEVEAPVLVGQQIGVLTVTGRDGTLAKIPICACNDVERMTAFDIAREMIAALFGLR